MHGLQAVLLQAVHDPYCLCDIDIAVRLPFMKAPSTCETITQQEIENNVIHIITALLNQQKPDTSSQLGVYAGICKDLTEKMPKAPNKDAASVMLRSVRRHKN